MLPIQETKRDKTLFAGCCLYRQHVPNADSRIRTGEPFGQGLESCGFDRSPISAFVTFRESPTVADSRIRTDEPCGQGLKSCGFDHSPISACYYSEFVDTLGCPLHPPI